ncbi:hypothetical protein [Kitasatospora purpeofusca]|uniref:hypothetical protein n=1 Tax=Kitasatospora purpeofusca TaxID=67352 RepID=UPI0036D29D17
MQQDIRVDIMYRRHIPGRRLLMGVRFTEDDFGVTHLASLFHQDWRALGSARDVVVSYVEETSEPYAEALADDAHRLAGSNAASAVATLWECATGSNHQLDADKALAWFREIATICESRLSGVGWSVSSPIGESPYGELRERVVAEIDQIGPRLAEAIERNSWKGIPEAVASLRFCAVSICPELAFRILMRVLMEYSCNIDPDRYVRFVKLGREFSHGEFVVSRAEFLVS